MFVLVLELLEKAGEQSSAILTRTVVCFVAVDGDDRESAEKTKVIIIEKGKVINNKTKSNLVCGADMKLTIIQQEREGDNRGKEIVGQR